MTKKFRLAAIIAPAALAIASCAQAETGDSSGPSPWLVTEASAETPASDVFEIEDYGTFSDLWAMAFEPGTGNIVLTEKRGGFKLITPDGTISDIAGAPEVAFGGQGGLGDVVFAPDYATSKAIYLSWAQADEGAARRAVVGKGTFACTDGKCAVDGLEVIWRQEPAINSFGHFSHRIAFSPDGKYLFVTSGDRMQGDPAQDISNNLGTVVRLNPDGSPAGGNPFADKGGVSAQIWSYGHRNLLGLAFDSEGRLWDIEHGPRGGDEINLVEPGKNYGWPVVSDGDNYNGDPIPRHATRTDFALPAISWNPVISPGDMIFYSGEMFPQFRGEALIAAMGSVQSIVRVDFDGTTPREVGRIKFGNRLREIEQAPDGALWVLEDRGEGRLLRLTPKQ